MAIQGLTGKGNALPIIGKLFKGGQKQKKTRADGHQYETFGKELHYWRFESKFDHIKQAFDRHFKDEPQELFVYLPFPTPEENFQTCKEAYTRGALQHRCDGQVCSLWLDPTTQQYKTEPIPCPTLAMTPQDAVKFGCKEIGRLNVVIPALNELGFVTMETHSKNDIVFLDQILPTYQGLHDFGLTRIPFSLYRYQKEISAVQNGQRVRVKKWLVGIKPMTDWAAKYLSAKSVSLLNSAVEVKMLQSGNLPEDIDDENDETEILCAPEIAAAIESLWPEAGPKNKDGQIVPMADYLARNKGVQSPSILPADSAATLLDWMQKRALANQHPEQQKAEPGAGLDQWACGDRALALDIVQLTEDLEKLGVDESAWRAELAVVSGKPDDTVVSRKSLTFVEASAWRDTLKAWILSKS